MINQKRNPFVNLLLFYFAAIAVFFVASFAFSADAPVYKQPQPVEIVSKEKNRADFGAGATTSATVRVSIGSEQVQSLKDSIDATRATVSATAAAISASNTAIVSQTSTNQINANASNTTTLKTSIDATTASVSQTSINEINASRDGLAKTQIVTSTGQNYATGSGTATSATMRVAVTTDTPVADWFANSWISTRLTVGTTQVEAKVGGSPLANRRAVIIYNDSPVILFYGPTGVTSSGVNKGESLFPNQSVSIPLGPAISVFVISATASQAFIVRELN